MARKRYDDHSASGEHHERWLISYADFITLLFAFFVVMYAISIVNEGKYAVLSEALGDAFGGRSMAPQAATSVEPVLPLSHIVNRKRLEAARREQQRLDALAKDLSATLLPLVKSGQVRVTQNARGISVEINASILFDQGEVELQPEAREVLGQVAGLLKDAPQQIEVEGHTDNLPIATKQFASNWELSAVRAASVVRLFIEGGVQEARLAAIGHGSTRPVARNDSPVNQARNRRVAVMILASTPDPLPPGLQ